jgi:hypothetical protein
MRLARRLAHVLIVVLTMLVGATAAAIIVTQTAWFKDWLRGYIVREANNYLNGTLSIERLGGNLFFGVELEDVGVSLDGEPVVSVADLGLDYNVFQMISGGLSLHEIRVNRPVVYLRREGGGWTISRILKKQEQEADREGPQFPIGIDAIGVSDASVVVDDPVGTSGVDVPARLDRLDAQMTFAYEPVHYSLEISHLSFRTAEPQIALNALSGAIAVRGDTLFIDDLAVRTAETSMLIDGAVQDYLSHPRFNLSISSDKTSITEIARIVPALAGIRVQPAFEAKVDGPLDQMAIELNVRSDAGSVIANVVADVQEPGHAARGTLSIRHLNLAPLTPDEADPQPPTDLTADARFDVHGARLGDIASLRGVVSMNAPRLSAATFVAENVKARARLAEEGVDVDASAAAYGARATAVGRILLARQDRPLSYDLEGRLVGLDLRRLPTRLRIPAAETSVTADYHVTGTEPAREPRTVDGSLRFADSTVAGARIDGGSIAAVSMRGGDVSYRAEAKIADLDLQRIGAEFEIPALADARYTSVINVDVTAAGRGTRLDQMDGTARGIVRDTALLGGRVPEMTLDASVSADTARLTANGEVADLDPSVISGKSALKGFAGGTLAIDATVANVSNGVTLDNVKAEARVTLQPSTIGGLAVESATLDGNYDRRAGEIQALEVVGRDLNVSAKGIFALNEWGSSRVVFHADSPSLETLGQLFDLPVSGIGRMEGTITGNAAELNAAGKLVGNGVKYGAHGALAIDSSFAVSIPDLAVEQSRASAETHATFVTVAGQNINELTATTTYADKRLDFDATAKQPDRSLTAAGALVLHPEHQEVHLQRLGLAAQGQHWTLQDGREPTIQYSGGAVTVRDAVLVNRDQQIRAQGTWGRPPDQLNVTLTNVDLAGIDALLLRQPQFTGRLNASATLAGTRESPDVEGRFQVDAGGFRQFTYDSFAGTAGYRERRVTLDARLDQNATQWISAKGTVPMALFGPRGDSMEKTDDGADPAKERVDLSIDSSPLDLGVVQGFTTAVTDVRGTLEAHVRVEGTADDPRPSGAVTVQDGALTVAANGVTYTNLTGQIDLQPDGIHIDQITVLDNHQSAMTLVGDLALRERQVGNVELYVTADDFKVVDNDLGNVRLDSRMQIAGDLSAPRVEGYLGVSTGELDLDEIVALVGTSVYSTEPTALEGAGSGAVGDPPSPGLFDRITMNVDFHVPNDLVVKASSLQAPGAPIGLGALNMTLGGDLRLARKPGDRLRVYGRVNTVRGNYDFQGRRFEILRDGSVRFEGLDELNPSLDLRTRRIIRAVEARVNIRGTLKQPEIELSSTPPLEQADILALIVFNQPINELGQGEQISLAARAQALAAGAVADQLAQSLGEALNLDTLEINMAPEAGGGPQLTVGEQLGQSLYVRVQQAIGEQSSTNFILEYELTDWLRLQTNMLQGASTQQSLFQRNQGSGADLIFFFSY